MENIETERSTENLLNNSEKPSEVVCTFCMKTTCEEFTNIHHKSDLVELLKKLCVDISPIKGLTDWICYQCIYKLNCIRDYSRNWSSCVTKSRINYYYRLGEKEMVRRLLNLKNNKPSCSLTTNNVSNNIEHNTHNKNELKLKIASVRSIRTNDLPKILNKFKENLNNGENDEDNTTEYLSVMYEKSESVLLTESGGKLKEYRRKNDRLRKNDSSLLKCKTCNRTYVRFSLLKKHERKHERDFLKSKMAVNQEPITITCSYCDIVFSSLKSWQQHYKTHQESMKCSYCSAQFILQADLELHEAICYGVLCAHDDRLQSGRYNTRSSRRTNKSCEDLALTEVDSMYTCRLKNVREWIGKNSKTKPNDIDNDLNDEINYCQNSDNNSCATSFTRASSRIQYTGSYVYDLDHDDLSSLSRTAITNKSDNVYNQNEQTEIFNNNSRKRKKKNNDLSNDITDKNIELIKCPEENCNFVSTSLLRLQEHDLTVHDVLPLFTCKSCHGRFLRLCYLQHHLKYQNYGRFICHKCERIFSFENDLKKHFADHNLAASRNDLTYSCSLCNMIFLEEFELQQHLITPNHFQKKQARKTMFLVRTTNLPLRESIDTELIAGVQPYKSEIRIQNSYEPETRRHEIVFRRWKPGRDPQCVNDFEYPNCAAKQYKNLGLFS